MTNPSPWHRLSARSLFTAGAATLAVGTPTVLALIAAQTHFSSMPRWGWTLLWCYFLYSRLYATLSPFLRHRYRFGDDGVSLREGSLFPRHRHFTWKDVSSVRVTQPWPHRLAHVHRVQVATSGGMGSRIVLEAVPPSTAEQLEHIFRSHGPVATTNDGATPTLYSMRATDAVLTGFSYGQFLIIVPSAIELSNGLPVERLGLRPLSWTTLVHGNLMGWTAMVTLALILGTTTSLVKYSRFTVQSLPSGITTSRGFFTTRRNSHNRHHIHGFVISQNLAMQAFGYYRLDVLTTAQDRRDMTNTVLPCARWPLVLDLMSRLNSRSLTSCTAELPRKTHGLWRFFVPVTALIIGLVLTVCHTRAGIIVVLGGLLVGLHMNRWQGSFALAGEGADTTLVAQNHLLSRRYLISPLHALWGLEVTSSPLSRVSDFHRVAFHGYSGRHLTFRALVPVHLARTVLTAYRETDTFSPPKEST